MQNMQGNFYVGERFDSAITASSQDYLVLCPGGMLNDGNVMEATRKALLAALT